MNKFLFVTMISGLPLLGYSSTADVLMAPTHEDIKRQDEFKSKGYIETYQEYAKYLLDLQKAKDKKHFFKSQYFEDKIFDKFEQISLMSSIRPTEALHELKSFGISGMGSYTDNGWNGYRIYFEGKNKEMCSFSYMSLNSTDGCVFLDTVTSSHKVKDMDATYMVEGDKVSGYLYSINWYSKDTVSMLDCALSYYSPKEIVHLNKLAEDLS